MPRAVGASWSSSLEGEAAGCTQVLNEMAETGYVGTELGDWGFMPTDPDALAAELTKRGLTMLGAFVPVALKDPASARARRRGRAEGGPPAARGGRPHHRLRQVARSWCWPTTTAPTPCAPQNAGPRHARRWG